MPDQELSEWAELSRTISEADRVRHEPPAGLFDEILGNIGDEEQVPGEPFESITELVPAPTEEFQVIDLTTERIRRAPSAERQRRRSMVVASLAAACVLVFGFGFFAGADEARWDAELIEDRNGDAAFS